MHRHEIAGGFGGGCRCNGHDEVNEESSDKIQNYKHNDIGNLHQRSSNTHSLFWDLLFTDHSVIHFISDCFLYLKMTVNQ